MTNYQAHELQQHYLEVCELAKEEPQAALLDLIMSSGKAPDLTKRVRVLEHLGEVTNQERQVLHDNHLWSILDALREAGYEDTRILRFDSLTEGAQSSENGLEGPSLGLKNAEVPTASTPNG